MIVTLGYIGYVVALVLVLALWWSRSDASVYRDLVDAGYWRRLEMQDHYAEVIHRYREIAMMCGGKPFVDSYESSIKVFK